MTHASRLNEQLRIAEDHCEECGVEYRREAGCRVCPECGYSPDACGGGSA